MNFNIIQVLKLNSKAIKIKNMLGWKGNKNNYNKYTEFNAQDVSFQEALKQNFKWCLQQWDYIEPIEFMI